MRGDFETDNLSNLIELTAKNINIIYKSLRVFDLSLINKVKNIFIRNTRNKSKDIANTMEIFFLFGCKKNLPTQAR